jgi:glycerol-3-phosphate dehydrogenase (NAD(P)+)
MERIAVIGAGYMGSAITFPILENQASVNLWGTWLDDEIIDCCRDGRHPKLKKCLLPGVRLFNSPDLGKALEQINIIVIGISSDGFASVFERVLDNLDPSISNPAFFTVTKGFVEYGNTVQRVSKAAESMYRDKFPGRNLLWVSIGGPVKAVELAYGVPSLTIYGTESEELLKYFSLFQTSRYRIAASRNVAGVELSSALKNAYAISLGIADGLGPSLYKGKFDNLKALLFSQSVCEISEIVSRAGGDRNTAFGIAGTGDLYVTTQSGRNQRFGELIGRGSQPGEAYQSMFDQGELAEGYHALKLGLSWMQEVDGSLPDALPLFRCLCGIVLDGHDPEAALLEFAGGI